MINHLQLRRLFESAQRDGTPERFFRDLREGLRSEELRPADFSIRSVMENFIEDGRAIVDSWNPRHGEGGSNLNSLLEAGAVDTSAFNNITGQIAFTAILEGYQSEEFVFTNLIPTQQTQFNGEKLPRIAGIGDEAEVIDEGHAYPMVGVQEDWIETPETRKRGMIPAVTREAAFFDRTGQLLSELQQHGYWLGVNKEKRAIDCVIDENTTVHRYRRKEKSAVKTYGDNSGDHDWDNLEASNGLVDWTDIDNANQLLNAILDPNTGEPIVITADTLICTKALELVALRIRNATEIRVATPGFATTGNPTQTTVANPMGGAFDVVTSRLLASRLATDTDWFYGDPRRAFKYMENWGITPVQAPPNSELEFTNDIVFRWKASERGQYATTEPRLMEKNTA